MKNLPCGHYPQYDFDLMAQKYGEKRKYTKEESIFFCPYCLDAYLYEEKTLSWIPLEEDANDKIRRWCFERSDSYEDNIFVQKLRKKFTKEQILEIIRALHSTCEYCLDTDLSERTCYCQCDE